MQGSVILSQQIWLYTKPQRLKKKFKAKKFKGKKLKKKATPFKSSQPSKKKRKFFKKKKNESIKATTKQVQNKIVGVGTAMKKDTLQMNVQSKLTLQEFILMNYLSNLQDAKKSPGLISSSTTIFSS